MWRINSHDLCFLAIKKISFGKVLHTRELSYRKFANYSLCRCHDDVGGRRSENRVWKFLKSGKNVL
jgi:hypothetical protein